ncbi:MAG TPA: OsmC family protein, partial [Vicinamibacteria bacterium]|nr:OsmC family protein [Vicinamibacteria bacterium]
RAIAARARLDVAGYRTTARGTLDRTAEGARFTSITLVVDLDVADRDRERALELLRKAKQHCIVANSLAAPVTLEVGELVPA